MASIQESAALYENVLREASAHRATVDDVWGTANILGRERDAAARDRDVIAELTDEIDRLRLALSDITVADDVAEIHEIASVALGQQP